MPPLGDAFRASDHALMGDPYDVEPDDDDVTVEPIPAGDLVTADRILRRVARVDREQADIDQVYEAQRAQLDAWRTHETEKLAARRVRLEDTLAAFHRAVLEHDPKRRTISLPAGELRARKGQPTWVVTDDAALIAWAEKTGAPILADPPPPPAPRLDRNRMKATLTQRDERGKPVAFGVDADGERPPGLEVEDAVDGFTAVPRDEQGDTK